MSGKKNIPKAMAVDAPVNIGTVLNAQLADTRRGKAIYPGASFSCPVEPVRNEISPAIADQHSNSTQPSGADQ
jgi:hypothetical protein